MDVLDLRSIRCPLALVTLKQTLLSPAVIASDSLNLLFSTKSAMLDITLYLDKKSFQYILLENEKEFVIMITLNKKSKEK